MVFLFFFDYKSMEYTYILQEETPAKKNNRMTLRNGRTIVSKRFIVWHAGAVVQIYSQKRPAIPIETPTTIKARFYHKDRVRRDSDNQITSILDLLKDTGVIADDNWEIIRKIEVENFYCKEKSFCKISLNDYTTKNMQQKDIKE